MEECPAITIGDLVRFAIATQNQEYTGCYQFHHHISRRHRASIQLCQRNREQPPPPHTGSSPLFLVAELELPFPRQMIDLDSAVLVLTGCQREIGVLNIDNQ